MTVPLSYFVALLSIGIFALSGVLHQEVAAGIPVSLSRPCPADLIGDRMDVVVSHGRDGTLWLDNERLGEQALRWRVADQMKRRFVKIVWIAADKDSSYGDVVSIVAKLKEDTPDLTAVIATRLQTGEFDPAGKRYATAQPDTFFASIQGLCIDPLPQ